jgi:hypothetical protein
MGNESGLKATDTGEEALDKLGVVAQEAHEKAADTLPAEQRWQYVAACVVLAFDKHMSGRVAILRQRPLVIDVAVLALNLAVIVLLVWKAWQG